MTIKQKIQNFGIWMNGYLEKKSSTYFEPLIPAFDIFGVNPFETLTLPNDK